MLGGVLILPALFFRVDPCGSSQTHGEGFRFSPACCSYFSAHLKVASADRAASVLFIEQDRFGAGFSDGGEFPLFCNFCRSHWQSIICSVVVAFMVVVIPGLAARCPARATPHNSRSIRSRRSPTACEAKPAHDTSRLYCQWAMSPSRCRRSSASSTSWRKRSAWCLGSSMRALSSSSPTRQIR